MPTDDRTPLPGPEVRLGPGPASRGLGLSRETLQHLIPFHLIWNGAGELVRISDAVLRLWDCAADQAPQVRLHRPFDAPLEAWMFPELTRMVVMVARAESAVQPLRGELIALDEGHWLFTGVPALGRVSDLELAGLRLSDLPLHTGLGDALIASEAAQTSLELSEAEKQRLAVANRLLMAMDEVFGTAAASNADDENYFRALIENSSDTTFIVDDQATVRYVSPSVGRVLGCSPRSMVGRGFLDLIDPADGPALMKAIEEVVQAGATRAPVLFRFRLPDGQWRHLEAVGRILGEDSGKAQVVMNARDVTDRMALEQRLRQSHKMESIGRLAGGVAHDFNNILTVIQGHAGLLQMSDELSPDAAESAREIVVAAERAATLTRQLLTFSRRQTVRTRPVDVQRLVGGMGDLLRRILGEDIALELEVAPGPLMVFADEGMVEQVLMNLSANSRDAMPNGGRLVINASPVTLEAEEARRGGGPEGRAGRFIRLSVADTGAGISAANLGRLFEPFFTTKEFGQGTGLGLATVHGILKSHGGWVEVDTEVGRGTVFRTYWPAAPVASAAGAPARGTVNPGGAGSASGATIFVVEDEPPLRDLVCEILSRQGFDVITAVSGAEAIELWPRHRDRVQLLLTDIVMPGGVNGWDLAARLKADRADLAVIYTSGYSPDAVDREGRLLENEMFLQKPYDPAALIHTVLAKLQGGEGGSPTRPASPA